MNTLGQNKLEIAILGVGAVGGFLAALFYKNAILVTCIAKESQVKEISEKGIRLESSGFGDFIAWPKVVSELNFYPDVMFITTKSTSLKEALKKAPVQFLGKSVIIPLLNGIEHVQLLRGYYGKQVIAATIGNVEVKRVSVSHVVHTTPSARIELAANRNISFSSLQEICRLLVSVGIKCEILDNEAQVLWGKLVRLNAIACTTAAANQPIGFIRCDPQWRRQLEGCVREAAAVAQAEGAKIDPVAVMTQIDSLPAQLGTSLQRDIASGKPSELDAIATAIVRAAQKHGIPCPSINNIINILCRK